MNTNQDQQTSTECQVAHFVAIVDGNLTFVPAVQGDLSNICLRLGTTIDNRLILAVLPRHTPSHADDAIRAARATGDLLHIYSVIESFGGRMALSTVMEEAAP